MSIPESNAVRLIVVGAAILFICGVDLLAGPRGAVWRVLDLAVFVVGAVLLGRGLRELIRLNQERRAAGRGRDDSSAIPPLP